MAENKKVLLQLRDVKMHFPVKKDHILQREQLYVRAVDGVTVDIYEGETFGLVGESGCGKSTLGRCVLNLYTPTDGKILYFGVTLDEYAPQYVKKIIHKIDSVNNFSIDHLIEKNKDEVTLAGGLLLCGEMSKLSQLLMKKFHTCALLHEAKETLEAHKFHMVGEEQGGTAKQHEQLKKLEANVAVHLKQLEADNLALEALRKIAAGKPGYEALEEHRSVGVDLSLLTGEEMRRLRRYLQIVFQDPYSSLNPRLTVGNLISEALVAHELLPKGSETLEKYTLKVMEDCGLQKYMLHRYPHQFSGGQRQRIGIARALALNPTFVVCDEAVSALDVSIQSQIINLLMDLKDKNQLTYLFISHDLSTVKFISDRVGVMYLGNIIELGLSQDIYDEPLHPYTEALLEAIPTTEESSKKELQLIEGDIPSPIRPPSGCKFHTRCRYAKEKCKVEVPEWRELKPQHYVACHYPLLNKRKE